MGLVRSTLSMAIVLASRQGTVPLQERVLNH